MVPTAIEQEIYAYMQRKESTQIYMGTKNRDDIRSSPTALFKKRVEEAHHSLSVGEGKPLIKEIVEELLSGGRSTRRR